MVPNLPLYTKTTGESTTLNDRLGTVLAVFNDPQVADWVKDVLNEIGELSVEELREIMETEIA